MVAAPMFLGLTPSSPPSDKACIAVVRRRSSRESCNVLLGLLSRCCRSTQEQHKQDDKGNHQHNEQQHYTAPADTPASSNLHVLLIVAASTFADILVVPGLIEGTLPFAYIHEVAASSCVRAIIRFEAKRLASQAKVSDAASRC